MNKNFIHNSKQTFVLITPQYLGLNAIPKRTWGSFRGQRGKLRRSFRGRDHFRGCTFKSQRGCRKHVNTKHSWFFFFDEKPDVSSIKKLASDDKSSEITKPTARGLPSFSISSQTGESFIDWKWWGLQERPCSSADSQEVL